MKKLIEKGIRVGDSRMFSEDKIWSAYSNDKVDIGETLARVIRTLSKALPLSKQMTALSIGSSNEPQFRILETAFRGGLFLLDIEKEALDVVQERIRRQDTDHVTTLLDDFKGVLLERASADRFFKSELGGKKMDLVTLHHSLYYCREDLWRSLFDNILRKILAPAGAVHAVMMSCGSKEQDTTGWLYDHFAGKFFGWHNDQDLDKFRKALVKDPLYKGCQIRFKRSRIRFFVDDFEKFMAVIWMILLYPSVHPYTVKQREEIARFVYDKFWKKKKPLVQYQDHLVIYRGIGLKGLV